MSCPLDHGLIRTAAVERVVAPIACHLCHLVLLCDSAEEPEQFRHLEETAQAVAKATENMAAVASRRMRETVEEVLQMEMSSLLESVTVSGQHVLLAAQKLSIQPTVAEHREDLIAATQNVFLGVVKVLLVDDDATVRRVVAAADRVLESLSELGSSPDIKSLLRSFQAFSDALLLLNGLTVDRANSLQDPRQTKQLLDSLETLRMCMSMLHTAMCTTIKHAANEQARAAKRFILDKVQSTVSDIIITLNGECNKGSLGPFGYYTGRRTRLLQILTSSSPSSIRSSGFDSTVRDLVLHCMVVANSSRSGFQRMVVGHCRHILQFWSVIRRILKSSENLDDQSLENTSALLVQQMQTLDRDLMTAILYQVLDTFLTASSTHEDLLSVLRQILEADSTTKIDLSFIQPLVEDFISSTDRITQVANLISAVAVDAKSLESVENSRACLTRLRARIAPLSLELADDSMQTVQKLHEVCQKWEEETGQLQDAISDVMDVRHFTSIAINEMVNDRHGCDAAFREQSYKLFSVNATHLICHMKLVIHSVKRHLDRSDNPIYRNGLLVLLRQVQSTQTKVGESVRDMLFGSCLNVEAYSSFSDNVSTVVQHFKQLNEVMPLCADMVQLLASSDITSQTEHFRENDTEDTERKFETAAKSLFENVKSATKRVEDSLNYIHDPRTRSNLRSINDHLSFQITDVISRARLVVETHYICDTLSLDVHIQCWSAKAHYVVEEVRRQDGIRQETKEHIRTESDCWDPKDNRIVQMTRKMADTMYYMTQYLKKKGPIPNKEAFVTAAKDMISNCHSLTQFIRVIANHCLDKQCTIELSLIVEQILTTTSQLNIISSVNAVTPGSKSSDEILVKNAQNLLQTVLRGVRAAETACITGLKQPEPNSDGAEATALCFQWKRNLEIHRAQQTSNPETDELGLRKTSSHPVAPSLAPPVNVQDGYK
ncbi:Vinculin domain containing protein [Scophthalmus maximus]|uniref:Vinculin domain containing protein n=1 Tax=Scophthalmus maximus TaxID=52904 RepID=A0A2U9CC77_SCOMX|nr:Vinculin domain containing protein [Scophthalmus maximus]